MSDSKALLKDFDLRDVSVLGPIWRKAGCEQVDNRTHLVFRHRRRSWDRECTKRSARFFLHNMHTRSSSDSPMRKLRVIMATHESIRARDWMHAVAVEHAVGEGRTKACPSSSSPHSLASSCPRSVLYDMFHGIGQSASLRRQRPPPCLDSFLPHVNALTRLAVSPR